MSEREDDFATVREALGTLPLPSDLYAALARIQAHVEALEGALREIAAVADRNYAEPITGTIVEMCDEALAGHTVPTGTTESYDNWVRDMPAARQQGVPTGTDT